MYNGFIQYVLSHLHDIEIIITETRAKRRLAVHWSLGLW
jgi:hypothetical protein